MKKLAILSFVSFVLAAAGCGRGGFSDPATETPSPTATATATATPLAALVGDPRASNIAIYDAFATIGSPSQAQVDDLWSALEESDGGVPARANGRIVFMLRDGNDGWFVAGSFNGWSVTATPMTRIAGTDTLVADVAVTPGVRISYKFVNNGYWAADPDDHWEEFDGIDTGTVGNFNSLAFPGASAAYGSSALYRFRAHATILDNDRDVFVQVPAGYFPSRAALPLLVMNDGNESICRGRFDALLDAARGVSVPGVLVAFVALHDQNERMAEYTFGTTGARGLDYEAFIADELVPDVETLFATPKTSSSRGIAGASLGGLISYRIAFDRPDVFGIVGGQSSSFFWNNNQMIDDVSNGSVHPGRWYLDAGSDADNGDVAALMHDALVAKGYTNDYVRDPVASHDWPFWGERLPGAVGWMYAGF